LELAFESASLRTICESEQRAKRKLGANAAEALKHRLADLRAATCARDLLVGRPRRLDGGDGQDMVLDVCDGHRIVFSANHSNNPKTESGDVDWAKVSRIKIRRIERDHD
jgi:plasmid maintenance system killer protein